MKITPLNLYNVNIQKPCKIQTRHFSFTSLNQDNFSRPNQNKVYKYNGRQYYKNYPLGLNNSYTLFYYGNVELQSKNKNKMPYPPDNISFEKPVDISQAVDVCNKHYFDTEDDIMYNPEQFNILKKFVESSGIFKKEKVVSVISAYGNTVVFELEENRVLKMVKNNPFSSRKFDPDIDIPLLSDVYKYEDYYFLVQEKANTDVIDESDVIDVVQRIKEKGYLPYDIDALVGDMQIGWSPSLKKMMLIDSECAQGKCLN